VVNAIDQPGTDEADWRAWTGLRGLPAADFTGWSRVLVLAAHPDDEVLGVGGTIALLAAAGTRLRLVSVTDGEASHPGHPDPAALATRRAAETASALRVLGAQATDVIRLGFPDTGVAAREDDLAALLPRLATGCDAVLAPGTGMCTPTTRRWGGPPAAPARSPSGTRCGPGTGPARATHGSRGSRGYAFRCGPRSPPANAPPSAVSPASWSPGVPAPAPC
jgi:hypothetical protein